MPLNPQQTHDRLGDTRQGFDLLLAALHIVAFPVQVMTTRLGTWGSRCHGPAAALGFFWPLALFVGCARVPGSGFLLLLWIALVVRLALHEARRRTRERAGVRTHTRYWGASWFEPPDADLPAQESARAKACLVVLAIGVLTLAILSPPLGGLLILGAFARLATDAVGFGAVRVRLRLMQDARLDTEFFAALSREKNRRN